MRCGQNWKFRSVCTKSQCASFHSKSKFRRVNNLQNNHGLFIFGYLKAKHQQQTQLKLLISVYINLLKTEAIRTHLPHSIGIDITFTYRTLKMMTIFRPH